MTDTNPLIHSEACPLAAVDRRLSDLHRQWHDAERAYFNPDSFRVAIQTCIQTARTVTFILQSNKGLFSAFDEWYAPWQDEFRAIPLMKWMVDARNTIEKRGDLETHSELSVAILASHLSNERPAVSVTGDLFDSAEELLSKVPRYTLAEHVMRDGILQIERRWVANSFQEFELLDAVANAYGHLSRLVHDAHINIGLPEPRIVDKTHQGQYDHQSMDGKLPCMIGHRHRRTLDIWLASGEPLEMETKTVEVNVEDGERAITRYEIAPEDVFGDSASPQTVMKSLFQTARTMFLKDHHHITITFLLKEGKTVDIREWRPDEHGHKYLMAQMLADQVKRVGADAVILLGEIWMAKYDPQKPLARAVDSPDKIEALAATLITVSGEPERLVAEIERFEDRVELSATTEDKGGAQYLFAPVYEAWGREIPEEWT